jgi:hypothetical protein
MLRHLQHFNAPLARVRDNLQCSAALRVGQFVGVWYL